ncbi:MAG TPA: hypothetical protein VMK12_19480 [Anaeromyxobacteraceae bacterium]|nr:hypothetical protein [Anaeromyxobacteraceae bacterium]
MALPRPALAAAFLAFRQGLSGAARRGTRVKIEQRERAVDREMKRLFRACGPRQHVAALQ